MFFDVQLLKKRGRFGIIWLAATCPRKLKRRDYLSVNIANCCSQVIEHLMWRNANSYPFSLYLSSQLTTGLIRVNKKLVDILLGDIFNFYHEIRKFKLTRSAIDLPPPSKNVKDKITLKEPNYSAYRFEDYDFEFEFEFPEEEEEDRHEHLDSTQAALFTADPRDITLPDLPPILLTDTHLQLEEAAYRMEELVWPEELGEVPQPTRAAIELEGEMPRTLPEEREPPGNGVRFPEESELFNGYPDHDVLTAVQQQLEAERERRQFEAEREQQQLETEQEQQQLEAERERQQLEAERERQQLEAEQEQPPVIEQPLPQEREDFELEPLPPQPKRRRRQKARGLIIDSEIQIPGREMRASMLTEDEEPSLHVKIIRPKKRQTATELLEGPGKLRILSKVLLKKWPKPKPVVEAAELPMEVDEYEQERARDQVLQEESVSRIEPVSALGLEPEFLDASERSMPGISGLSSGLRSAAFEAPSLLPIEEEEGAAPMLPPIESIPTLDASSTEESNVSPVYTLPPPSPEQPRDMFHRTFDALFLVMEAMGSGNCTMFQLLKIRTRNEAARMFAVLLKLNKMEVVQLRQPESDIILIIRGPKYGIFEE